MLFFFSLTIIGLFLKIWVFTKAISFWQRSLLHKLVLFIVVCTLFQSCIELVSYLSVLKGFDKSALLLILKLYYVSLIIFITTLPYIAWKIAGNNINYYAAIISIVAVNTVLLLVLFSDAVIKDVELLDYTITRVAGEYYWVFQVTPLLAIFFTIATLVSKMRAMDSYVTYVRCANMLVTFLPLGLFLLTVIILMSLGYKVNAVGFLPLFLSIYVGMIAWNLSVKTPPDFSFLIPGSPKQKLIYKMFRKVCRLESEERPINPESYQGLLVKYAVEVCKGNQREAAKLLNTSPSTVSRMIRKQAK